MTSSDNLDAAVECQPLDLDVPIDHEMFEEDSRIEREVLAAYARDDDEVTSDQKENRCQPRPSS